MLIIQIALGIVLAVIVLSLLPVILAGAAVLVVVGIALLAVVLGFELLGIELNRQSVGWLVLAGLAASIALPLLREWWSERQGKRPVVTIDVDESSDALLDEYQRKAAETRRRNAAKRRSR